MKNKTELVFIQIDVWFKTQNFGEGKKVNPHANRFYSVDEAIEFFNGESSAYKIEAGIVIRNPLYMYGDGHMVTIFEKGVNDVGKKLDSDMLKKAIGQ